MSEEFSSEEIVDEEKSVSDVDTTHSYFSCRELCCCS